MQVILWLHLVDNSSENFFGLLIVLLLVHKDREGVCALVAVCINRTLTVQHRISPFKYECRGHTELMCTNTCTNTCALTHNINLLE